MSEVVRLADYRRQLRRVRFDRGELAQILAIYSGRVARGEWRDYAIHQDAGMATFLVFRRAAERPLFAISKLAPGSHGSGDYVVVQGWRRVKRGRTMDEVLSVFEMEPQAALLPR